VNRARAAFSVAQAAVGLAARALPRPEDRARYRDEFVADLHELSPAGGLRYAAGVLSQVLALRAALGRAPSRLEEHAMTFATQRVPFWRCRVLRLHRWARHVTEDGGRYEACSLCGEDRGPAGLGPMTTPPWPGRR
jgi:hypothetical protein